MVVTPTVKYGMSELIPRRTMLLGLAASSLPLLMSVSGQAGSLFTGQTPDRITDKFSPVNPSSVQLQGFLGARCLNNERARLLTKDESDLLGGFQQRPGKQAWVGEHAGKWLQAATLAWAFTKDAELKVKLDRVAGALLATQQPDGYLGTYADGAHWVMGKEQSWDVWVHKYDLLGLLTYAQFTGNQAALEAARKIGDLLLKTFGPGGQSGSLDLNERSTHVGMASGSVLEPLVLLYRATSEAKYLEFARFCAEHWEEANGPKLISALTNRTSVKNTANGKAYEMLSCLVGLCELYRATGDPKFLTPVVNAWQDVATNQLLITGSGSSREHWTDGKQFLSAAKDDIAETCVTVTWIQLTGQLLRLTGDARYADELEKTYYNHLAAAQRPDGAAWSYFTALDGKKPYKTEQNCCTSSGPRGWALLPSFVYMTDADGVVVNLFTPSTVALNVKDATIVVKQETAYPREGRVAITVTVPKPMKFALRVRVPSWSHVTGFKTQPNTYWLLRQTWSGTQTITLDFALPVRQLVGEGVNGGRLALVRGPVVLTADQQFNSDWPLAALALNPGQAHTLKPVANLRDADGAPVYETEAVLAQEVNGHRAGERVSLRLTPFAAAGTNGSEYQIWFARAQNLSAASDSQ